MAKAEAVRTVTGVTLELSELEARTLRDIFQVVGGIPDDTRRGVTDGINDALREAGVVRTGTESRAGDITGSIHFADEGS